MMKGLIELLFQNFGRFLALLLQHFPQIFANRRRSLQQVDRQLYLNSALCLWHLNLVKVANSSDHLNNRHRSRAILVDFAKPFLELSTVKVGAESVHLLAERLQPEFSLEHI